jgi:endonuclease/exonuclease/phosphatase (EEP) superfamily protein YafD
VFDRRFPFVASKAWRPHVAAVTALGAVALARRRPRLAAVLGVSALLAGRRPASRLVVRKAPPPSPADLTLLTANVLHGRADTSALATIIEREQPDFAVLPEAGTDFRDKLMPLVEILGYRSWVTTREGEPDSRGIVLLASARSGDLDVRVGDGMWCRHLEVTGGILGARRLYAVHPAAPMSRVSAWYWRRDLRRIAHWTRAALPPFVLGDFNATLDHSAMREALGSCRSAAEGSGLGLVGTFPAQARRWAGIQIDHVLVPVDAVTTRFTVLDVPGSDHRAVVARVRL